MDGGSDYFRGTCNYAKVNKKAGLPEADCYFLEFQGVASSADVYVNGKAMAHHDGGYSTWRVAITPIVEGENAKVKIETFVTNQKEGQKIKAVIKDAEGKEVCKKIADSTTVRSWNWKYPRYTVGMDEKILICIPVLFWMVWRYHRYERTLV